MEIKYGIKNFRIFDTKGTEFNLKPITILTGANCAGKSSLVKSLLLLKNYFEKGAGKDYCPEWVPLSFSDEKVYINGIDKAINNRSKDNKTILFCITRKGVSDNVEYRMELFFASKDTDILNDGWLNRIRISCIIDGTSDVFIDVSVSSDGKMSYDVLDLTGNVYKDFKRNLDIASYQRIFEDCRALAEGGYFRSNYPNQESLDNLNRNFDELLKRIKDNPLNESIDFSCSPKYIYEFIDDRGRYERALDIRHISTKVGGVEFEPLNCFNGSEILLYLPILNEIGGMNPAEFKQFIDSQKKFDARCMSESEQLLLNPNNGEGSVDYLMDSVVEAYSNSGVTSFGDFYKKLETNALSDVGQLSANDIPLGETFVSNWRNVELNGFGGKDVGFIKKIETASNMLVHLRNVEFYFSQSYPFEESLIARKEVDFYYVYRVLTYLERKRDVTDKENRFKESNLIDWTDPRCDDFINYPESKVFVQYKRFISKILSEFLQSRDIACLTSVGSFLCPVLRSYSIYDMSNPLSSILLSYFDAQNRLKAKCNDIFIPGSFINKWIQLSGIGRAVKIDMNDDHSAFRIRIVDNRGKLSSSADYGHGVTQLLSILIHIETVIMLNRVKEKPETITICFEEPEVSLHPSWQSMLARVFRDAYDSYGIHFILETHSEYLTRATQAMVAEDCSTERDLKRFPCVVYYMEKNGSAYDLEYQLSGRFRKNFGSGFFDEACKSSIKILEKEEQLRHGKNV